MDVEGLMSATKRQDHCEPGKLSDSSHSLLRKAGSFDCWSTPTTWTRHSHDPVGQIPVAWPPGELAGCRAMELEGRAASQNRQAQD